MDVSKDYYKILGVSKDADETAIKKAYRTEAKKYHPDKNPDNKEAEEKFKEASNAYEILKGKERQIYDKQSEHGANYDPNFARMGGMGNGFQSYTVYTDENGRQSFRTSGGGVDPREVFEQFKRRASGYYEEERFYENLDITLKKIVTLKDLYNNTKLEIKYNRYKTCDRCTGTGFDPESNSNECEACDGTGKDGFGVCKYCLGKGKIHTGTCTKCNGEKRVEVSEIFNLDNIYQIKNRTTQKILAGFGHHSKFYRGKKGNVILIIEFQDNSDYQIQPDSSLAKSLNVHYKDAIDGYKFDHAHLNDKNYKITIPEKTKDGDLVRVKERGLLRDKTNRGDLYFKINIIIDYERVTDKKKKLI